MTLLNMPRFPCMLIEYVTAIFYRIWRGIHYVLVLANRCKSYVLYLLPTHDGGRQPLRADSDWKSYAGQASEVVSVVHTGAYLWNNCLTWSDM